MVQDPHYLRRWSAKYVPLLPRSMPLPTLPTGLEDLELVNTLSKGKVDLTFGR